jgi:hypothetical protein
MITQKSHDNNGGDQRIVFSEEDKKRIRAEEIFRDEVRREIEGRGAKLSLAQKLWPLLNSSFAVWFLSSVVLAGLTAAIARYQKGHRAQAQRAEIERRLNTEIGSRITESLVAMHLDLKRIKNGQAFFASGVYSEALSFLDNNATYETKALDFSIYPEYRWRSGRSLIFELSAVSNRSALPALRGAKASYTHLIEMADEAALGENPSQPPDMNASLDAVKKSIEILEQLQANSFWHAQL